MEIILTERVPKLGNIGDVVNVKDGYARNFLLPQRKAVRSTDEAKKKFEAERSRIEAESASKKVEAEKVAAKLEGKVLVVIRQAGESGQLYGSVNTRDVSESLNKEGFVVPRQQIVIPDAIKELGVHSVLLHLHGEVEVSIRVNVALSVDEANAQLQAADAPEGKSYGSDSKKESDDVALEEDVSKDASDDN